MCTTNKFHYFFLVQQAVATVAWCVVARHSHRIVSERNALATANQWIQFEFILSGYRTGSLEGSHSWEFQRNSNLPNNKHKQYDLFLIFFWWKSTSTV